MNQETTYEIDWNKYKGISYSQCMSIEKELIKSFHNCSFLMEKKKRLEQVVRQCKGNQKLKRYFKIEYCKRKINFYQKIMSKVESDSDIYGEIAILTNLILDVYYKKRNELEYVSDFSNNLEAEQSHREEMRESYIEDFRGCD
jgi:hypothetical protein